MRQSEYNQNFHEIAALPAIRRLVGKTEKQIFESGKPVIGSKIEIRTAGEDSLYGDTRPNAWQAIFEARNDGWYLLSGTRIHQPLFADESAVILTSQPEKDGFADMVAKAIKQGDPKATIRNQPLAPGFNDLNDMFEQRRKRVLASMLESGQVRQGPAVAKSWNTRQPKEDFAPETGDRTSSVVDAILAGRGMTPPSPEARRLDAIRAVYDAADEGNKVQSALTHAREIASDLGEIEPAKRISALFGLIKSAQVECAEIARELAVSRK